MGKKEKEILINSFVHSNFNYCPLVWHLCSKNLMRKIEKIQERCLRIILDDYESNYKALLHKLGQSTMKIKRFYTLPIETFKTLNNQNPGFMREIFYWSTYVSRNLFAQSNKTAVLGDKSLKIRGPHIWNLLPEKIKLVTNLVDLKNSIKNCSFPNACATYVFLKWKCRKLAMKVFHYIYH